MTVKVLNSAAATYEGYPTIAGDWTRAPMGYSRFPIRRKGHRLAKEMPSCFFSAAF